MRISSFIFKEIDYSTLGLLLKMYEENKFQPKRQFQNKSSTTQLQMLKQNWQENIFLKIPHSAFFS